MSNILAGLETTDTLIYIVFCVLAGLIGYLISDRYFNQKYTALEDDFSTRKTEMDAFREQNDILVRQAKLATPEAEVNDLRNRLKLAQDEKIKFDGDYTSQTGVLEKLKAQLSALQNDHDQLQADAHSKTTMSETQIEEALDTLNKTRDKIKEIAAENDELRKELNMYKSAGIEIPSLAPTNTEPTTADTHSSEPSHHETSPAEHPGVPISSIGDSHSSEPPHHETSPAEHPGVPISSIGDAHSSEPSHHETSPAEHHDIPISSAGDAHSSEPSHHETTPAEHPDVPISSAGDTHSSEPSHHETSPAEHHDVPVSSAGDAHSSEPSHHETSPAEHPDVPVSSETIAPSLETPVVDGEPLKTPYGDFEINKEPSLSVSASGREESAAALTAPTDRRPDEISIPPATTVDPAPPAAPVHPAPDATIPPTETPDVHPEILQTPYGDVHVNNESAAPATLPSSLEPEATPVKAEPSPTDASSVHHTSETTVDPAAAQTLPPTDAPIEPVVSADHAAGTMKTPYGDVPLNGFFVEKIENPPVATEPLTRAIDLVPRPPVPTLYQPAEPVHLDKQEQVHADYSHTDDLKIIAGVSSEVEQALKTAGVHNWRDLSVTPVAHLKEILAHPGASSYSNDPTYWPEQAIYLANGEYDKFEKLKRYLSGGVSHSS